jgi:DNA-binding MarR family transcriptional regulator
MALGSANPRPAEAGWGNTAPTDEMVRFLHAAHLLGALLREFLESRFLESACPEPLTRVQFCLLKLVVLAPGIQVGDASRRLGQSPGAGSKNAERLVRLGLIDRRGLASDRRASMLFATTEGERRVREYEILKTEHLAPALSGLDEDRRRHLCEQLEAICEELAEGMRPLRDPCFRCAGYPEAGCPVAQIQGHCALAPADRPT